MKTEEILQKIDHTNLRQDAKWKDIAQTCEEALRWGTASACIPSCYVGKARNAFPTLKICTVIGFPLGYQPASVKQFEAAEAVADGADEIDMVINVSALKSCDDETVRREISAVRSACAEQILKVIIETCCLTDDEKKRVCALISECGADFVKTSTGFGKAGADLRDIALFRENISSSVKIKAAGGIRTREQMEAFLAAGCDRIGCSATGTLFAEQ